MKHLIKKLIFYSSISLAGSGSGYWIRIQIQLQPGDLNLDPYGTILICWILIWSKSNQICNPPPFSFPLRLEQNRSIQLFLIYTFSRPGKFGWFLGQCIKLLLAVQYSCSWLVFSWFNLNLFRIFKSSRNDEILFSVVPFIISFWI